MVQMSFLDCSKYPSKRCGFLSLLKSLIDISRLTAPAGHSEVSPRFPRFPAISLTFGEALQALRQAKHCLVASKGIISRIVITNCPVTREY